MMMNIWGTFMCLTFVYNIAFFLNKFFGNIISNLLIKNKNLFYFIGEKIKKKLFYNFLLHYQDQGLGVRDFINFDGLLEVLEKKFTLHKYWHNNYSSTIVFCVF